MAVELAKLSNIIHQYEHKKEVARKFSTINYYKKTFGLTKEEAINLLEKTKEIQTKMRSNSFKEPTIKSVKECFRKYVANRVKKGMNEQEAISMANKRYGELLNSLQKQKEQQV